MNSKVAGTKWCPMVRCVEMNEPTANCGPGEHRNPEWARCIGKECALWVFKTKIDADGATLIAGDAGHCGLIK